ncbi:hypothetical protein [Phenylobacterium sp.]|uniref:hypothetical protein n=1 Tax=Phenylobacterium sp. TaxID=1871053 RepID=UPI001204CB1D|nr:hypothetical protein [Phenylobacterium sp.]THD64083.1 MAG: hypothetical protein E8A49_03560 [Phenylobacterium sp.]
MQDELKTAGVVALVGAAVGAGVALGLGLRVFSALAMVGLGTGIALGVIVGGKRVAAVEGPPPSLL